MSRILVFGGTSEGRRLAERLEACQVPALVCVATEYGETLLPSGSFVETAAGRLDQKAMEELLRREAFRQVVDATHPYAAAVSQNLKAACTACGVPYLRLLRQSSPAGEDCAVVASVEEAVAFLARTQGTILVTTGSKELAQYTSLPDWKERLVVRVLSTGESVDHCRSLGFEGKNLIAMQGPFSEELNLALLRQVRARYLVTKESGLAGGFPEKLRAARRAGVQVVLIRRPVQEEGDSFEEVLAQLGLAEKASSGAAVSSEAISGKAGAAGTAGFPPAEKTGEGKTPSDRPALSIVGVGMGSRESLTGEAEEAFRQADAILAAGRVLPMLEVFGKPMGQAYRAEQVRAYAQEHPDCRNLAVGVSGDVGFYSGAKRMLEELPDWNVRLIPGVSSPVYFCARLGIPWEDVALISLHGRQANLPAAVRRHRRVFTLAGGKECSAGDICQTLLEFGLGQVQVTVGQNLSYPEERIQRGTPEELAGQIWDGLQVLLIENPEAEKTPAVPYLPDEAFLRGKAPMTKEEIREISLCKLRLTENAVAWDVGAGTGSVSVEMARAASSGSVYAVEKKPEALELLRENRKRFGVPNLTVVEGTAPAVLQDLPAPTHVFLGGTSGNLREILAAALRKNPRARVVVNAVTLETLAEITGWLSEHPVENLDIAQITVAKARMLGNYHLMTGGNPVAVFSFDGREEKKS